MPSIERFELEFPCSAGVALAKFVASSAVAALYLFLAFQTTLSLFNIGFIFFFSLFLSIITVYRILKTERIIKEVASNGEYREERRGGYVELYKYAVYFTAPLLLFLFLDPVLALGGMFGLASSFGFSDALYYLYVRNAERRIKGVLKAFLEPSSKPGRYVWGLRREVEGYVDER